MGLLEDRLRRDLEGPLDQLRGVEDIRKLAGGGQELPALDGLSELGAAVEEKGPRTGFGRGARREGPGGPGSDNDYVELLHRAHGPARRKCWAAPWIGPRIT